MRFSNWFRPKSAPLTGAPSIRRIKSYSAQSGYLYRYSFEGSRPAPDRAIEYVFRIFTGPVSSDSQDGALVTVRIPAASIRAWEQPRSRHLSSAERYAVAKLALFQSFDDCPAPSHLLPEISVRPADLTAILDTLDI